MSSSQFGVQATILGDNFTSQGVVVSSTLQFGPGQILSTSFKVLGKYPHAIVLHDEVLYLNTTLHPHLPLTAIQDLVCLVKP